MTQRADDRQSRGAHRTVPAEPVDAVVLGEALVDLFPPERDLHLPLFQVDRFVRHLGGAGANLAVNLSRQGVKTALCTQVGGDPFGHFLRERLAQEGVAVDGVVTHKSARTGITFVSIGPRGERSFLFYGSGGGGRPAADVQLQPGDLSPALLRRGRLLCLGSATMVLEPGRLFTQQALELCRKEGMLVGCDLNFRAHKWPDPREAPPILRRLLSQCDVVKLAEDDLLPILGTEQAEAAAARVRQSGPAVVVVTLGERGAYLDCPAGQVHLSADAARVVDPTGAGDAFTAGLLAVLLAELGPRDEADLRERLRGLDLPTMKRACARGNYLAAWACTAVGATSGVP
jgi:fructokinase